jgi:ubiquinone biosynthesis protein
VLTQLSRLWRLIHISLVLVRHGLDEVLLATHLFRPVYFLSYLSPWYWYRRTHPKPYPVRIREALIALGPIFVKFGQILSTRRDLLPDDLADELAKLQDQVPPFPRDPGPRHYRKVLGQAHRGGPGRL